MDAQCVNHPERQAVTKCAVCEKPVCQECMVPSDGSMFCSKACAKDRRTEGTQAHKLLYGELKKRGPMAKIVRIVILGAIAVAILYFLGILDPILGK